LDLLGLQELKIIARKLSKAKTSEGGTQYKPELPEKKRVLTSRRITFSKQLTDINKVSEYLFDEIREPNEVGEICFDRFLDKVQ
jgi:hypothetical protein